MTLLCFVVDNKYHNWECLGHNPFCNNVSRITTGTVGEQGLIWLKRCISSYDYVSLG